MMEVFALHLTQSIVSGPVKTGLMFISLRFFKSEAVIREKSFRCLELIDGFDLVRFSWKEEF